MQSDSLTKIMPLVLDLMNAGGWDIVKQALESKDPARPLGTFLAELIMKVAKAAQDKGLQLDMKVFLQENGVVERLLDLMEKHFDMPEEFSEEIFDDVVLIIQKAASGEGQTQPPQAAPQQPGLEQMGG